MRDFQKGWLTSWKIDKKKVLVFVVEEIFLQIKKYCELTINKTQIKSRLNTAISKCRKPQLFGCFRKKLKYVCGCICNTYIYGSVMYMYLLVFVVIASKNKKNLKSGSVKYLQIAVTVVLPGQVGGAIHSFENFYNFQRILLSDGKVKCLWKRFSSPFFFCTNAFRVVGVALIVNKRGKRKLENTVLKYKNWRERSASKSRELQKLLLLWKKSI